MESRSFGECQSLRKLCSTVGLLAISVATAAQTVDVQFADITGWSGVDFTHENSATSNEYLIETIGGGIALFDYDNEGRTDIFFTNGAPAESGSTRRRLHNGCGKCEVRG